MECCVHKSTRSVLLWKPWKHSLSVLNILITLSDLFNVFLLQSFSLNFEMYVQR